MPTDSVPRYPICYRSDEIRLICQLALRGESLGLVGIAGVGKSNLVNYLRVGKSFKSQYFGLGVDKVHFCVVGGSAWGGTTESLWSQMLSALGPITKSVSPPEAMVIPFADEDRALSRLQAWLARLCQESGYRIVYILDDFDNVILKGPLSMLDQLSELRSCGNRGFLSYVVFTKLLPHVLGKSYDIEKSSKFYDLIRHNIYALEPYTAGDALQMLKHLNAGAGGLLHHKDLIEIYRLAGGHGQLLKTVFQLLAEERTTSEDAIRRLAEHPDVQQECQRIIAGLHEQEQQVAWRAARGNLLAEDWDTVDHLVRRRLVTVSARAVTWFSPLMASFLQTWEPPEA